MTVLHYYAAIKIQQIQRFGLVTVILSSYGLHRITHRQLNHAVLQGRCNLLAQALCRKTNVIRFCSAVTTAPRRPLTMPLFS